ncbi:protein NUCLEAR FUSION DEFECTIVE 4-like isoform X2 [Olea europaea var. sylvestris]|uniref:protein NUCLEAR FUSION DEFECTIVE 4-like isoform X2 n=1 Tax=Olea europaea var. sylvestris TaxID=158386 RepID=UPI000C1D0B55|nr:protein NUCLEAR FUSION DEFECTIVE 4-like isoform X2 [Olea europaea var. sylvestris]
MKTSRDSCRCKFLPKSEPIRRIAAARRFHPARLLLSVLMGGQSRKWMIVVATIWIQAFTGTNFDFSAYSSELKAVLGVSQVQLNYLATASDLGKALGWSSGLALMYLPLWMVMFLAAAMGLIGYGVQWLVIRNLIALPYFVVFLLCLLAGCSICWFNTVCFVLCIKNFPAVIPILLQPPVDPLSPDAVKREQLTFLKLNLLAVITGLYLLFLHSSNASTARFLFAGAIFLLILPLGIPGIIYARDWFKRTIYKSFQLEGSGFMLVDADDLELHKELLSRENSVANGLIYTANVEDSVHGVSRQNTRASEGCSCETVLSQDRLVMLGEEHKAKMLLSRIDFWLYYLAYFCGGTIGLVYSNNLGQIAQSLGQSSMTSRLITMYSSFSFFGRLLSATPDFIRTKFYFARTGWLVIALLPTPIAFFLLAATDAEMALQAGTALIGLSSGFIFAAAVSITSEIFGPNSVGVNHNILITNIPVGSLVYGFLAATFYDSNAESRPGLMTDSLVCMGRKCYFLTFVSWGCISILGLASSLILFLRTRLAYDRFERNRLSTILVNNCDYRVNNQV